MGAEVPASVGHYTEPSPSLLLLLLLLALFLGLVWVHLAHGLLQRADLVVALLDTILVGLAGLEAGGLQVLQSLQGIVEHLLRLAQSVEALEDGRVGLLQGELVP